MKLTVEFFCLVLLLSTFHGHETTNETTLMILNQQWVPNCDTLLGLIREYREGRGIPDMIEKYLMLRNASPGQQAKPKYYTDLPILQKVEVFEAALDDTTGKDVSKMLWLRSPSSEVWLERRTTYSRSLALMSMVGYVLGLGQ